MLIDRRAVSAFLERELDDFTWMKRLRREALERELSSLRVPPHFKTKPWLHQLVCFYIGLMKPRFLFLLDMGLGKSKIFADLITQTQREKNLEGAIITVPRLLNVDSWVEDLEKHSDLEPWRIDVNDIEEKRERLLNPKGDVTIIDYQGLTLALSKKGQVYKGRKYVNGLVRDEKLLKHFYKQYNWFGADEIHKLANTESIWFDLCERISERMEYAYGATGTIFGKDPEALWPPFYLIDRGATFGENKGLFRASFFTTKMNPWKGVQYFYDERMDGRLHEMLQNSSIRYSEDEVPEIDLPPLVPREHKLDMTDEQRGHYLRALEGLINAGGKLADLDAQWLRMRQITSGYLVWKDEAGEHLKYFKENPKLEDLEATIENCGDSKIVIGYVYTHTGRMIVKRLKELGIDHEWLYGGTKDPGAARRRFLNDPKCRAFVMNDEAGGTGNDGLQKVARYMYLYETPSDPKARSQIVKRVHRPGSTRRVFIYDAVMKGSVDRGILDGIKEGVDIYQRVVNGKARYKNLFMS